jgi:hypothetical protein
MARVGVANYKISSGTENLINQQDMYHRQAINREHYAHPSNSLKIKVPQPSFHGIQSTSNDFYTKTWHVLSKQSGQQRFPSAGKQTFFLGGGSTTTPIYPFEKYATMRPPVSQRENWYANHPSARPPPSRSSSLPVVGPEPHPAMSARDEMGSARGSSRDAGRLNAQYREDAESVRSSRRSDRSGRSRSVASIRSGYNSQQVNLGSTRHELERAYEGPAIMER